MHTLQKRNISKLQAGLLLCLLPSHKGVGLHLDTHQPRGMWRCEAQGPLGYPMGCFFFFKCDTHECVDMSVEATRFCGVNRQTDGRTSCRNPVENYCEKSMRPSSWASVPQCGGALANSLRSEQGEQWK